MMTVLAVQLLALIRARKLLHITATNMQTGGVPLESTFQLTLNTR